MASLMNLFKRTRKTEIVQESIDVQKLKDLIISASSADIEILIHEEPRVDIVFETYEDGPKLKIERTNDVLTITAKKEGKVTVILFGNIPKCHLQLKVPKDIADHWQVSATSGKISAAQLISKTIDMTATSGTINLSEISAEKVRTNTASGKLKVHEMKVDRFDFNVTSGIVDIHSVYGDIIGQVVSGNVKLASVKGQELDVKTGSGRINLDDVHAKSTKLHATSGKIEANHLVADSIHANVASGKLNLKDITGTLKGQAISGSINLTLTDNATLDLKTGSGNINLEFQEFDLNTMFDIQTGSGEIVTNIPMSIEKKQNRGLQGKAGEGENLIRLRTGSGKVVMYSSNSVAAKI